MRSAARLTGTVFLVFALSVLGTLTIAAGPAAGATGYGGCQSVRLAVGLTSGSPANQTVSATYCQPSAWAPGAHEIDVLTPGATYNRMYWDWPQDASLYSYVDKTLQAGRATFDYDRVGTGQSSHPASTLLNIVSEGYVLHEIVTWLRAAQGYAQVNLIGHSLGSVISIQEAGTYRDVSRVVLTGLLHIPNVGAGFASTLLSLLYPAALDPQFTGQGLDLGYLTTLPGDRGHDFYSSSADPTVIAYDEAHKEIVPATDLAALATTWALPPGTNLSSSITAPVLVLIGQQDAIFCTAPPVLDCTSQSALQTEEAPFFGRAASFTIESVPATGHDIALHPSADTSFTDINQWISGH